MIACWFIYKIGIEEIQKVREILNHVATAEVLSGRIFLHKSFNNILITELKEPGIQIYNITIKYLPNFVNSIQSNTEKYTKLISDIQLNDI